MKKIYSLMLALFAVCMGVSAQGTATLVSGRTEAVTSLEQVTEGMQLGLYCVNRGGFVREGADMQLYMDNFEYNTMHSSYFVFTINSIEQGDGAATITLGTPRGHYMPTFVDDEATYGQWSRWMGLTVQSTDSIGSLSLVPAGIEEGGEYYAQNDSLFYIFDENGVYFNGQELGNHFVGWNSSGSNSLYKLVPLTTNTVTTYPATVYFMDTEGEEIADNDGNTQATYSVIVGDSITAPEIDHYTFKNAADYNTDDPVDVPYHVTEAPEDGEINLIFYYDGSLSMSLQKVDDEGNDLGAEDLWLQKGSKWAPTAYDNLFGYALQSVKINEDEQASLDTIVIQDDWEGYTITLTYKADGYKDLPVVPTTVTDGAFAADTKYYFMKVRGGYAYYNGTSELALINSIDDFDAADNYIWAFTGNLIDGIAVYNKGVGAGSQVYTDGTGNGSAVMIGTEEEIAAAGEPVTLFKMGQNGAGFSIYAPADNTACWNRYGGATGEGLKYWTSSASPTDAGSRITFEEVTDATLNNMKFATARTYLGAENAVGGFTTAELADLKAAVEANDLDAANAAIEVLDGIESSIVFDTNKAYNIVSGYNGYPTVQGDTKFALYVEEANDTVKWAAMSAEQAATDNYKWAFVEASDTTYTIHSVLTKEAIASFRWGQSAVLTNDTIAPKANAEDDIFYLYQAAPVQITEFEDVVASFRFTHKYGASMITLSQVQGSGDATLTSGTVHTYNTVGTGYMNYWRLVEAGTVPTGINGAAVDTTTDSNAPVYDLQGRRVKKADKGLYIIGGKKVLVK